MRVLLVTNGLLHGGAERILEALAEDLLSSGSQVEVVATTRDGPIGDNLRARGIPVHILGIRSAFDATIVPRLATIARRFAPDVVHSHLAVADVTCALAKAMGMSPPWLSTIHSVEGLSGQRLKRHLWKHALPRAARRLAVSQHVESALRSLCPHTSFQIIHPSLVDLSRALPSREEARATLGLEPNDRVVLGVGRLEAVKRWDLLAEVAKALADTRVVVVGEGSLRAKLEPTHLELLGAREDAADIMAAADVVVSASDSEGFPQTLLQAMAAARPVVATAVGGTPEIVVDGRTGLLVPPGQPGALRSALDRLLRAPEEAKALGRAGRERLETAGLTRARMFEATVGVYRELAG